MIIRIEYSLCMLIAMLCGIKSLITSFPSQSKECFSDAVKLLIIGGILLMIDLYFAQHPEILVEFPYLQIFFAE